MENNNVEIKNKSKEKRANNKYLCPCSKRPIINEKWSIKRHENTSKHKSYLLSLQIAINN